MSLQYDYLGRKARFSTDPGRLDRSVQLLKGATSRDAVGGQSVAWKQFAEVPASKHIESGRRLYAAEQKNSEAYVSFRIRHRNDVVPFMRLQHGDDVYEIVHADELGREHFLDLTCRGINQTVSNRQTVPTPAVA